MDGVDVDALLAELAGELRAEQAGEAASIVAGAARRATFADRLRGVPVGEVVLLACADGSAIRGRILSVGRDVVTVGEVADPEGTARRRLVRVHDVRIDAVVRVVRGAA